MSKIHAHIKNIKILVKAEFFSDVIPFFNISGVVAACTGLVSISILHVFFIFFFFISQGTWTDDTLVYSYEYVRYYEISQDTILPSHKTINEVLN